MSRFRKVCLVSSLTFGAAALAGVAWYLYKRKRNRRRRPLPPPSLMAQWEYWKFCRKIGSLPPSLNQPRRLTGAGIIRENGRDVLYPDTSVFFFKTSCRVQVEDEEDTSLTRHTLWRYSFLIDKASPFCSFDISNSNLLHNVDFRILGRYLLVGLQGSSMSVLVFNFSGEFLRRIQLEHTPVVAHGMLSYPYFGFDENHCHLLVVTPAANRINSHKFRIHSMTDSGTCIQENTIQIPQNLEIKSSWNFGEGCALQTGGQQNQSLNISDPAIHYDYKSGSLTIFQPEQLLPGRLISWNHQLHLSVSLFNFEVEKSLWAYRGSHKISTDTSLDTCSERYLVCDKETGGEEEEHPEEEEEQSSNNLSIYSLRSEPKSLKALALSAVLKNFPRIKDLPGGEMRKLGIPPNIAQTLVEHKRWESEDCVTLGIL